MKILATLLSAAALSSFAATLTFSQTNGTGKALVASGTLQLSADTVRSGPPPGEEWTKMFFVPFAGVVRVRWQLKSDGSGHKATTTIYSATGFDHCFASTTATTYQQRVCNLHVVRGGDIVASLFSGRIRNVRVYYDVVDHPGTGKVLLD